MKLQHIAAAVALTVAGAANAAVDTMATNNSSLFLIAYDNAGGSQNATAGFFDLGFNLSDFLPTAALTQTNQKVEWDFANNTITVNGTLKAATNAWTTAFDKLLANSDAGQIKWLVGAGDSIADPLVQFVTTGTPTSTNLNSQNSGKTANMALANDMFSMNLLNKGTVNVAGIDNGAWTAVGSIDGATAAAGYVIDSTMFNTNWRLNLAWNSFTTNAKNNFWVVNANGTEEALGAAAAGETVINSANLLNNKGTFLFDAAAKKMTWETAALAPVTPSVPEASTYAMGLTALGLIGLVSRRRRG